MKKDFELASDAERTAFCTWAMLVPINPASGDGGAAVAERIRSATEGAWNNGYAAGLKAAPEPAAERVFRDVAARHPDISAERWDAILRNYWVEREIRRMPGPETEPAEVVAAPASDGARNGYEAADAAPNGHDAPDLAARITTAGTARSWSQKQLAEAAGTTPPAVSEIERGKITCGKRVARVLDVLGITA